MRRMTQELQFLKTLSERIALPKNDQNELRRLENGFAGEQALDRLQAVLTQEMLPCMDDLLLKANSSCVQIDKLLVVDGVTYVVDVKNYRGSYLFSEDEWIRNGLPLQENILEQLHNAMRAVKRIFIQEHVSLEVKGVLAFINPAANIEIKSEVSDLILTTRDISGWLLDLLGKAQAKSDTGHWQRALEKKLFPNFKYKRTLPSEFSNRLRSGIACRNCGKYHLIESRYSMDCLDCGHREPKETAYVRTICQCGVIFNDCDLSLAMLCRFFGETVNKRYLQEVLAKHFEVKFHKGRSTCYLNKGVLFVYWFEEKLDYFNGLEKRLNWNHAPLN